MKTVNLGVLAHIDAGKTTLSERLLYVSGAIRRAGSVDGGDAHTDDLEVERARGISVRASSARFVWKDTAFNLIDTPGHADFSGEIERSLRALDNAVLILSAVEGVQPQTEAIWRALTALNIPTLFFINKTDRENADVVRVTGEIAEKLGVKPAAEEALDEVLAENDLALMEKYLAREAWTERERADALRKQFAAREVFPLMAGSAFDDSCAARLLDFCARVMKPADSNADGPLSLLVYRVAFHPSLGRLAYVRLFGGRVRARDELQLASPGSGRAEKVTQIKLYDGVRLADAKGLASGDIGVLCGLAQCAVGDVYGDVMPVPQTMTMAQALISARVLFRDEDMARVLDATRELSAEDPLLSMQWEPEQRELLLSVTGVIQIEILQQLYRARYGLDVTFGEPTVVYKETPLTAAEGFEAYTMPKPCWAVIRFLIEPLPTGTGIQYESLLGPDELPLRYQAQIEQALPDALRQGPKGWQVTDCKITLIAGQSHVYHTHPLDFVVATPMALLNGLVNTGTGLLEPVLSFILAAPEGLAAKLLGEVTQMRGFCTETRLERGLFTARGQYPLAAGMDFPRRLAVLTGGRGTLATAFSHYEPCPPGFTATRAYRGVSPLDRARYILHVRKAL